MQIQIYSHSIFDIPFAFNWPSCLRSKRFRAISEQTTKNQFHFSRGQNWKASSSFFPCPETKQKRLLRRPHLTVFHSTQKILLKKESWRLAVEIPNLETWWDSRTGESPSDVTKKQVWKWKNIERVHPLSEPNRTLDHTERSLRQDINILPIFKLG